MTIPPFTFSVPVPEAPTTSPTGVFHEPPVPTVATPLEPAP